MKFNYIHIFKKNVEKDILTSRKLSQQDKDTILETFARQTRYLERVTPYVEKTNRDWLLRKHNSLNKIVGPIIEKSATNLISKAVDFYQEKITTDMHNITTQDKEKWLIYNQELDKIRKTAAQEKKKKHELRKKIITALKNNDYDTMEILRKELP